MRSVLVAQNAAQALEWEPIAMRRRMKWVIPLTNKGGTAGNASRPLTGREFLFMFMEVSML